MEQLLAHLAGDFLLQNRWMAEQKVHRWWPAIVHALLYTAPFILLTQEAAALVVIGGTHLIIDRFRLAKHVMWLKELISPQSYRRTLRATKKRADGPDFWLMVMVDNSIHLLLNFAAIQYWG